MFLLLAILILFILTLIHFLIHGSGKAKIINEIPGPKILPIVGNGLDFLTSPDEIFIHARDLARLYPKINRVWMLNVPVVNIYNPYDCEILVSSVKHIEKSFIYDFLHPWLNRGLLTSTGEKWHQRRKILTPTFHFSILKQFSVIFEERSRNLVDKLNPKGETIDITALVRSFTLHTICETAMGTDLDAIPDEKKMRYENAIQDMSRFFVYRMLRAWFYVPFIFSLSSVGKMQKKTISMLHNFTNEVIKERRTTWSPSDNEKLEEGCEDVLGKKKRLAMLDLLFSAEAEGKIDEDGIREEVDTFMFEGHDTLTSVLSCCLMEFANNHYIQDRILEEILDVFGNLTEKITVEKLNQLNYLERCVKEGLRLYPGVPLIGRIVHEDVQLMHLFYRGRSLANQSKTIARLWGAHERILNIYDADDIEVVLSNVKYSSKGNVYSFLHPWLKQGLLTSNGEKWQNRRKILTPTFHFNILRQYCVTFVEQSEKIVQKLKLEVGKKETDILPLLTDFTLQSICETAMGTNLETADQNTVKKYKDAIYDLGVLLVHRFTSMWLHLRVIYYLTPTFRKQQEVVSILHKFTSDVIDERRRMFNLSKKDLQIDDIKDGYDYQPKKRLAMLDLLLSAEAEGKIDAEGIREEVDTFMFEGHDTNTMAMMFGLMELANHPEIQDKISAELDEIFGDSNDPVTIEDLNKMRYLERCIKEILRLYPSVPFMNRQILEDMQLKDYLVPAGTLCNIHIYDLHRNAKYFPDPDKFDPDRHLPENCVNRHSFAYIPFSAGPRNCIGQKFAILEDKALLSAIIRNFKLEAVTRPQDIVFSADLVLRCQTRVKVRFVPRIK